jgi:hypothetical protein
MEFPATAEEADDSYQALGAGRSIFLPTASKLVIVLATNSVSEDDPCRCRHGCESLIIRYVCGFFVWQ